MPFPLHRFCLTFIFCNSFLHAASFLGTSAGCLAYLKQIHNVFSDSEAPYTLPVETIRTMFGIEYVAENADFHAFETELLSLYTNFPPGKRNWAAFAAKWKLSQEQVLDIETYYSLFFFDGHPAVVGDRQKLLLHVKEVTLARLIEENQHPIIKNYPYYKKNLANKSVPEMALELGLSQGDVYRQLSFLNLSVVEAFKGDYGKSETDASRMVRHYLGVESRGIEWNRIFLYQGKWQPECALLVQFSDQGMTYNAMAVRLNQLAGTQAGDADFRTDASIAAKLGESGLTQKNPHERPDISVDPYGIMKVSGKLVTAPTMEFIFDNYQKGRDYIADQLGVTTATIDSFINRQHISGIFKDSDGSSQARPIRSTNLFGSGDKLQKIMSTAEVKYSINDRVIDDIAQTNTFPVATDKSKWDALGTPYARFSGTSGYGNGQSAYAARLNDGRVHMLENLLTQLPMREDMPQAVREKVEKVITSELEVARFAEMPPSQQCEIVNNHIIDEVLLNNAIPTSRQNEKWKEFGVSHAKFFGIGGYAPKGKSYKFRLSDNRKNALEKLHKTLIARKDLASEQIQKVSKIIDEEIRKVELSERSSEEIFVLVSDRVIAKIIQTNEFPPTTDKKFWESDDISMARFFGYGANYTEGDFAGLAINKGRQDTLKKMIAHAENKIDLVGFQRKKVLDVLNHELENAEFYDLPLVKQKPIISDRIIDEIVRNGDFPSTGNLKLWNSFGTSLAKFFGTSDYASDGRLHTARLNNSRQDAVEGLLVRLKLRTDLGPEIIQKVEKELKRELDYVKFNELSTSDQQAFANNRLIDYVNVHNSFPSTTETHVWTYDIGVGTAKYFGYNIYAPTGRLHKTRLNDNRAHAFANLKELLKTRKDLSVEARARILDVLRKSE